MRRKTTVYLDDDLLRELKVEAAHTGCSVSDILEEALRTRGGRVPHRRRGRPGWIGSFASAEVTGESSEDFLRDELGRSSG